MCAARKSSISKPEFAKWYSVLFYSLTQEYQNYVLFLLLSQNLVSKLCYFLCSQVKKGVTQVWFQISFLLKQEIDKARNDTKVRQQVVDDSF